MNRSATIEARTSAQCCRVRPEARRHALAMPVASPDSGGDSLSRGSSVALTAAAPFSAAANVARTLAGTPSVSAALRVAFSHDSTEIPVSNLPGRRPGKPALRSEAELASSAAHSVDALGPRAAVGTPVRSDRRCIVSGGLGCGAASGSSAPDRAHRRPARLWHGVSLLLLWPPTSSVPDCRAFGVPPRRPLARASQGTRSRSPPKEGTEGRLPRRHRLRPAGPFRARSGASSCALVGWGPGCAGP